MFEKTELNESGHNIYKRCGWDPIENPGRGWAAISSGPGATASESLDHRFSYHRCFRSCLFSVMSNASSGAHLERRIALNRINKNKTDLRSVQHGPVAYSSVSNPVNNRGIKGYKRLTNKPISHILLSWSRDIQTDRRMGYEGYRLRESFDG